MELYWNRNVDPSRSPCLRAIDRKSFERGNFLFLRPALLKIAYFNSGNQQLSNGAQVMELYWNRNVDPFRSLCLKAIDRRSFESGNFLVSGPVLLKIAYFNSGNQQLSIAVLPKSCDKENLSIPLEAHHNAPSSEIFLSFPPKNWKSCNFFYLLANPAETAYLSVRDGKLSNAVRLVEFRRRKVAVHTFLGWFQAGLLRRPL